MKLISIGKLVFFLLLVFSIPFVSANYNKSLINITLLKPKYGISTVDTFDFVVRASNVSECRYSTNPTYNFSEIFSTDNFFDTEDGLNQTIKNFQYGYPQNEIKVYVLCNVTENGYINNGYPKEITIGVDKSPPRILDAYAEPDPVIETLQTTLHAETDDKTVCYFTEPDPTQEEINNYFSDINISEFTVDNTHQLTGLQDNKNYEYSVFCINRAEDSTPAKKITFTVNRSIPNKILEVTPKGYWPSEEVDIRLTTNRDATCSYGEGFPYTFAGAHSKNHLRQLEDEEEGSYKIPVQCVFDQGNPNTRETEVNFTIDLTEPNKPTILSLKQQCNTTNISATFTSTDNFGIKGYYYVLGDENNTVAEGFTEKTAVLGGLDLTVGVKYFWEAIATDFAGNNGTLEKSAGTEIMSNSSDFCIANNPPEVTITKDDTNSDVRVDITCIDNDGCDIEYFLINSQTEESCMVCGECDYKEYSGLAPLTISENTTLCYKATDSKNKSTINSTFIEVELCLSSDDGCCSKEQDNVCDLDCEEDMDPDCSPENMDSDGDGMSDAFETKYGFDPEDNSDGDDDEDDDGLTNYQEFQQGTNPLVKDTDGDGYSDKEEVDDNSDPLDPISKPFDPDLDTDEDGMTDVKEEACGLDPQDPDDAEADNDDDGLINKQECNIGTDLNNPDTDGDGYSDAEEVEKNTDPKESDDMPKSIVLNIILFVLGLGFTVGGILLFANSSPKKPSPGIKPSGKKPMVDFKTSQKQLSQETTQQPRQQPAPVRGQGIPKSALDDKLREKRQKLKLKKMRSVFDEFAEDTEPQKRDIQKKVYDKLDKIPGKVAKESSFDRLDDISKEDAFEELEIISKKDKKRRERLTKEEREKLDRLSEK